MRVRLLCSLVEGSNVHGKGTVMDMEPDQAKRFITDGLAVLDGQTPIEAAVSNNTTETATVSPFSKKQNYKEKSKPLNE